MDRPARAAAAPDKFIASSVRVRVRSDEKDEDCGWRRSRNVGSTGKKRSWGTESKFCVGAESAFARTGFVPPSCPSFVMQ